jgi:phosphoserine phosphatase
MIECIRMCEDVVELGEALLALTPRSSRFTADLARTFSQAAQACAQECGAHSHSHCQECASLLPQAAQSVQQLSTMGGQQSSQRLPQ